MPDEASARIVVIVHSYSGTTAIAGDAIREMLSAGLAGYDDPPLEAPPSQAAARPFAEFDWPRIAGAADHLYIGFPIWAGGAPRWTHELIERMDLEGRRVTFFYTYLHNVQPAKIEALREQARAAGAVVSADVPLLLPLSATQEDKRLAAWSAVWARPDLWHEVETALPDCGVGSDAGEIELCHVPSGAAWLGDPELRIAPRRVSVPAFALARRPVTQAQYRACSDAGACPAIDLAMTSCGMLAVGDDFPMPCVSLDAARQFCAWAGLRLPSEAEWVRAARGGGTSAYPWGDDEIGASPVPRGNFGARPGEGLFEYELLPPDSPWPDDGYPTLAPGCRFPAGNSPFGVCDLAGNLYEWVERSSERPAREGFGLLKGGSWLDAEARALRVGARAEFHADHGFYLTGVRCAGENR